MQILESSLLGLRAARLHLKCPNSTWAVTLFPMVHVGEAAFYEQVYKDAFNHDVVLVEGVGSEIGKHLARSYSWIDAERLGLIVQPRYPRAEDAAARIVAADLTAGEFHFEWGRTPLRYRLAAVALAPLFGLHRRFFASRESLAKRMSLEDRRSSEEILSWTPRLGAFQHCILGARDARLVDCLRRELDQNGCEEDRLAVIYGARHMRAVLAELSRRGFYVADSTWQTVFAL